MESLKDILVREMEFYATPGFDGQAFLLRNDDERLFAVVAWLKDREPLLVLAARIENDTIYIDRDRTDKPLVAALVQAGVPREKIKLVYAGEATYEIPPLAWKQPTAESTGD